MLTWIYWEKWSLPGILFCSFLILTVHTAVGQPGTAQTIKQIKQNDSVTVPASTKYIPGSFLRPLIMGSNYRKEWSEPVRMPVFRLQETGLVIDELGGGMQTTSLSLLDENKQEWVLRSVDKNAAGALPKGIKNPLTIKFTQDMISASHPYAALVVGQLAASAGIVAPKPSIYFIPDDPAFGKYRAVMANTVCFLERKEPTPDRSKTENTDEVLEEIVAENDHLVLQETVLRARLLDMLVADWDRHADQWKWGVVDKKQAKYFYAIPRDRDQAFFHFNGALPSLIRIFAMRHVNWFKKESRGLKYLNRKSWAFDKTFLNELDAEMWQKVIADFQNKLSDSVISNSVKRLPPEIVALSGKKLEQKLQSRRNSLLDNAMKYYRFISGTVHVSGTAEAEFFSVDVKDGLLTVRVFRCQEGKKGAKIYERTFHAKETGRIYLNGMDGNDRFTVAEGAASKIKLKIDGGAGDDTYGVKGKIKVEIKDEDAVKNTVYKGLQAHTSFR